MATEKSEKVLEKISELLPESEGFECHQFKIGSYNALAAPYFQLPYDANVLGIIVLNTPFFLENTFKKWLKAQKRPGERVNELAERLGSGPLQCYFLEKFAQVQKDLLPLEAVVIHDFDFHSNRRPKVLMTTCGHVAGAAFFYRPPAEAVRNGPKRIDHSTHYPLRRMGISLHPKYGGHFAYRAVFVFPNVHLPPDFKEKPPRMVLDTVEKQREAIELFNEHWRDGRYRDCGDPLEKYSELQIKYFSLPPPERWNLISSWFDED